MKLIGELPFAAKSIIKHHMSRYWDTFNLEMLLIVRLLKPDFSLLLTLQNTTGQYLVIRTATLQTTLIIDAFT